MKTTNKEISLAYNKSKIICKVKDAFKDPIKFGFALLILASVGWFLYKNRNNKIIENGGFVAAGIVGSYLMCDNVTNKEGKMLNTDLTMMCIQNVVFMENLKTRPVLNNRQINLQKQKH